ncbi:MAG: hypothetical protein NC203_10150 [Firmicutes bacterium]|nr:hypothetical protein [[Eubacterium] siraeum]MCM1488714.1 hypothetical protein [Bacillota bacterium]
MKKTVLTALIAVASLFLCSCSNSDNTGEVKKSLSLLDTTWYEDGMLYDQNTKGGDKVLCYYSAQTDKSAVMCGMPECTHSSKTSPDCGALAEEEIGFWRCGLNIIGDKLYYVIAMNPYEDSIGEIRLMECDVNGKNRRAAAVAENVALPIIKSAEYFDDYVLVTYFQNSDIKINENTGEFEMVQLDKSRFYIQKMYFTGNVETVVCREGYSATGSGTVYEDTLYYNFSYLLDSSTGESLTLENTPERYREFCILNMSTGEEKVYKDSMACGLTFGCFSPERVLCYDFNKDKMGRFYLDTEKFEIIGDYDNGYIEDEKEALFVESMDSDYWTKYNFESGEITHIPAPDESLGIYLNGTVVVGGTVWFTLDLGEYNTLTDAYISRDDFFNGKFENYKTAAKADI